MIKGLEITDNSYVVEGQEAGGILNFKKVNIFVGANNSGKSRFLRKIFIEDEKNKIFNNYVLELTKIYNDLHTKYGRDIFSIEDLKNLISSDKDNFLYRYKAFIKDLKSKTNPQGRYFLAPSGFNYNSIDIAKFVYHAIKDAGLPEENGLIIKDYKFAYIPMLRGLRTFDNLDYKENLSSDYFKNDFYSEKVSREYEFNLGGVQNFREGQLKIEREVFSGLNVYEKFKRMLLGTKQERKFVAEYQNFLSYNFFGEKDVTITPNYDNEVLKLNISGKHEDREIYNLGDGIQSVIISTLPVYQNQKENTVLFVEEPEMTMHPSMQRVLVETLTKDKFNNLQVFLTTHSNHFLDLIYDYPENVAIFSFEEITAENDIEQKFLIRDITNKSKILDLLGVRNSSVFLTNSVVWVEGVTDRMLLRKLLQLFNFPFKEEYDYSIQGFGGGNLDSFDFLVYDKIENEAQSDGFNVSATSKSNFIILDNDGKIKKTDNKQKKRDKLREIVGVDNLFDGYLEIENLIPFKIWVEVLNILLRNEQKEIRLKDSYIKNEKKFNASLGKVNISDLMRKYLIESKDQNSISKYYKNTDITCLGSSKKHIMETVIEVIDISKFTLEDFPQIAKDLLDKLFIFVKGNKVKK